MAQLVFVSHPEVNIDPSVPVPEWGLSDVGRHRASVLARSPIVAGATALICSEERKAQDTAGILSSHLGIACLTDARLGENDRSATGFLCPADFEEAADRFFSDPGESFRGWERAIDAQARIEAAVRDLARDHALGDLVIVSHGAVGTLLYCALMGIAIDRRHDQPFQGHYWRTTLPSLRPQHGWRPI